MGAHHYILARSRPCGNRATSRGKMYPERLETTIDADSASLASVASFMVRMTNKRGAADAGILCRAGSNPL